MSTFLSSASIDRLRCEYRVNPLGIDVTRPRLGWILVSDQLGISQSAHRILVADSAAALAQEDGNLWDSGKVISDVSIQIEYTGTELTARQRCFWKVQIWDGNNKISHWSAVAHWSMGLLTSTDWQAQWIGLRGRENESRAPAYIRKIFQIDGSIRSATVYATALGLYELYINGSRVGDHLLAPEWTDYRKRVQYQTYDVSALLTSGTNVMAGLLGNGWYCGDWQFWESRLRPIYGDRPWLLVQLEMECEDGGRQTVTTDESWLGTTDGPLRFSGIYEGETYDARLAMPHWNEVVFDAKNWSAAEIGSPEAGQLVWQRSEPIRVTQEIRPVSVTEPKPGIYVFDLGQNMAGWCRLQINEPSGTLLTLKLNEMLNPHGTVYLDNLHAGHLSQGDRQIIRYTSNGREETFEPHFTYQGFRYVEVHGLTKSPTLDFLVGRVFHTSFAQTGKFTCSNPLLNRLAENIQWSQRANIMGIPTDCCQRDERCGYTGDMNFFMPTALYNFDMAAFFNKWLVDLCQDSQMPDGHFADHAPTYGPGDGWNVGWSDAGIICPYLMYRTYGDKRVIREHYEAMKRNIAAQMATAKDGIRGPEGIGNGDWLNLGGGAAQEVIGTAYHAYNLRLMSEMAEAIGEEQDARDYAARSAEVATAFFECLIDEEGRLRDSSQTGYALAFTMGLIPPEKFALMRARFAEKIARFDGHLATGFIGTPRLLPGLHLAGRDDLAYRLLLNETYPSWLYPITLGATTIWERWDGWTPEKGFADPGMNSFNHYAFGAVGQYLYAVVGGIQETSPGYKTFRIHPIIGEGLTWAKTSFDSPYGRIESHWRRTHGKVTLSVVIPPNTLAIVTLPMPQPVTAAMVKNLVTQMDGVMFLGEEDGLADFSVVTGHYQFCL